MHGTGCRRCVRVAAVPGPNERKAHHPQRASFSRRRQKLTSWADRNLDPATIAKQKEQKIEDQSVDRLRHLGTGQHYNINVDHGQSTQYIDALFAGNILGAKSDIADGSLRYQEFRTYNNIQGDYFIAPRFLDKVALHLGKNYLTEQLPSIRVPLILGIWGPKGTGKTFQTELAFKKMGVEPIIMSAGELESDTAGDPGMLIRTRYRRAAEVSKVNGKMSCLMINDIDAGLGRFDDTGATVNNQMTCATLMNICDDPTVVSVGGNWRGNDIVTRTPIIVTGNDLSTLFAPLIRDGRMDKFFWEPNLEEKTFMVHQMYKDDGVSFQDVIDIIENFKNQPLDFFGALRACAYDKQILRWIKEDVLANEDTTGNGNWRELSRRLAQNEDLPEFETMAMSVAELVEEGNRLTYEQDLVNEMRLSLEYMGLEIADSEGEEYSDSEGESETEW